MNKKTLIATIILEEHKMIYMHNTTKYLDILVYLLHQDGMKSHFFFFTFSFICHWFVMDPVCLHLAFGCFVLGKDNNKE